MLDSMMSIISLPRERLERNRKKKHSNVNYFVGARESGNKT